MSFPLSEFMIQSLLGKCTFQYSSSLSGKFVFASVCAQNSSKHNLIMPFCVGTVKSQRAKEQKFCLHLNLKLKKSHTASFGTSLVHLGIELAVLSRAGISDPFSLSLTSSFCSIFIYALGPHLTIPGLTPGSPLRDPSWGGLKRPSAVPLLPGSTVCKASAFLTALFTLTPCFALYS